MKKLIIAAALMTLSASSFAEQWKILGTRPMGMGGAFVAVAQGPIAQYWNPGGMVKSEQNVSGMEIPIGVTAEFTGNILENASKIGEMATKFSAINTTQRTGGTSNVDQVAAFVKTLSLMGDMNDPGKGALVEIAGGLNFKFSKVALSVNNFTSMGLTPLIDTVNIGLGSASGVSGIALDNTHSPSGTLQTNAASQIATAIGPGTGTGSFYDNLAKLMCGASGCMSSWGINNNTQLASALVGMAAYTGVSDTQIAEAAATFSQYAPGAAPIIAAAINGAPYTANTSNLTVAGASFMEIAAGYAWNIKKFEDLSVGANVKMINGRTVYSTFRFLADDDTMGAFSLDNTQSSWALGLDVGVLKKFEKVRMKPKVGLVIRNLNSPKFDVAKSTSFATPNDYQLNRQVRLGFAINPARFWTIAMDMDLTKNKTPVRGFESRQLALGTEINIINRKAFNIPLRAGLLKNMAEKDSKMAFTFGSGINLLFMHLDVSGVVSSDRTEIDGDKYPTKVGLAGSFGLLF